MASEDVFVSKNLLAGEVVRKGITVTKSSGALSITSATYAVYDSSDDSIVTSTSVASIDGGNVTAAITAGSSKGGRYAIITWYEAPFTRKAKLIYDIK